MFVTSVSPLVLRDVTSGMNIGRNIFFLPDFSSMVGFLPEEVEKQIRRYADKLERKVPAYARDKSLPELKKIVLITSSKRVEWMGEVE